jgi:hypothetical protein
VILRSLGGRQLKILEQNYRNDAITQQLLLSLYEGKMIDFITPEKQMVKGKIIRSGFAFGECVLYVWSSLLPSSNGLHTSRQRRAGH